MSGEKTAGNVVEAAANGALDGLKLALNVGAMLVAFLGLVAVLDWGLDVGAAVALPHHVNRNGATDLEQDTALAALKRTGKAEYSTENTGGRPAERWVASNR